jgi:uncharacterized protein (DUF2141 family)
MNVKPLVPAVFAVGCLLIGATPCRAAGGNPTASSAVTVVVSQLVSTQAAVKLYFYNVREGFLQPKQYAFMKVVRPGGQDRITLPVELANGDWAVAITQDTNNNDKLDKNMVGIPTEPFAFSNNVRPRFAPPAFDDCKFTVSGPGKVVTILLKP